MIPDQITLPDGRQFPTNELLNQVTNRRNINRLHPEKPRRECIPKSWTNSRNARTPKYTREDRRWQSSAEPEEIAEKYTIRLEQAVRIKYHARYLLSRIDNNDAIV
jgi:hypothetical protein